MNKPSNWWTMDHDERRAWERQAREVDDLEYEKQRAQEAAEEAQSKVQRQRREHQARTDELLNQQSDLWEQLDAEKEAKVAAWLERDELKRQRDALLAACEAVVAYAELSDNCGICACAFDDHEEGCPYPEARAALAKGQS